MRVARLYGVLAAAALALSACGARGADALPAHAAEPECAPVEGELAAAVAAAALEGEYRLTLVAAGGERAGAHTSGSLRLRPYGPGGGAPAGAPAVLHGAAEVDLARVGAVAPGVVDAEDPAAPGVLVLEWERADGGREVALRLGADANRGGPPRFDGASMALFVTRLTEGGFAGRWESGAGEPLAAGHFCARRVSAARA